MLFRIGLKNLPKEGPVRQLLEHAFVSDRFALLQRKFKGQRLDPLIYIERPPKDDDFSDSIRAYAAEGDFNRIDFRHDKFLEYVMFSFIDGHIQTHQLALYFKLYYLLLMCHEGVMPDMPLDALTKQERVFEGPHSFDLAYNGTWTDAHSRDLYSRIYSSTTPQHMHYYACRLGKKQIASMVVNILKYKFTAKHATSFMKSLVFWKQKELGLDDSVVQPHLDFIETRSERGFDKERDSEAYNEILTFLSLGEPAEVRTIYQRRSDEYLTRDEISYFNSFGLVSGIVICIGLVLFIGIEEDGVYLLVPTLELFDLVQRVYRQDRDGLSKPEYCVGEFDLGLLEDARRRYMRRCEVVYPPFPYELDPHGYRGCAPGILMLHDDVPHTVANSQQQNQVASVLCDAIVSIASQCALNTIHLPPANLSDLSYIQGGNVTTRLLNKMDLGEAFSSPISVYAVELILLFHHAINDEKRCLFRMSLLDLCSYSFLTQEDAWRKALMQIHPDIATQIQTFKRGSLMLCVLREVIKVCVISNHFLDDFFSELKDGNFSSAMGCLVNIEWREKYSLKIPLPSGDSEGCQGYKLDGQQVWIICNMLVQLHQMKLWYELRPEATFLELVVAKLYRFSPESRDDLSLLMGMRRFGFNSFFYYARNHWLYVRRDVRSMFALESDMYHSHNRLRMKGVFKLMHDSAAKIENSLLGRYILFHFIFSQKHVPEEKHVILRPNVIDEDFDDESESGSDELDIEFNAIEDQSVDSDSDDDTVDVTGIASDGLAKFARLHRMLEEVDRSGCDYGRFTQLGYLVFVRQLLCEQGKTVEDGALLMRAVSAALRSRGLFRTPTQLVGECGKRDFPVEMVGLELLSPYL